MQEFDADRATTLAVQMFNALSATHDRLISEMGRDGLTAEQGVVVSYIATAMMLKPFLAPIKRVIPEPSWSGFARLVKLLCNYERTPNPDIKVPTA